MTYDDLVRQEWGRLVARILRITGDWALAEDCVQGALTRAWETWGRDGFPSNPGAWLAVTARNLALDHWRRREREHLKLAQVSLEPTREPDDLLSLMFLCCHPTLALESQVCLTLRSVAGLTTAEVARAFLVSEETMTRRLTRAKEKLARARIPFQVPDAALWPERLEAVLAVLYLLFNQGNDAGPEDWERATLVDQALRLGRLLVSLMPREPEARGLLALMQLTWGRRPARYSAEGRVVTLELQDRTLWNHSLLEQGMEQLTEALACGAPGVYTLQAAIAGCHARASRSEDTDYGQIAGLYARLEERMPSPVVRLNRAVAVGLSRGPEEGLRLVQALAAEAPLAGYYLLPAAEADFLRRLGRRSEAADAYRRAAALAPGATEKAFLEGRYREMRES